MMTSWILSADESAAVTEIRMRKLSFTAADRRDMILYNCACERMCVCVCWWHVLACPLALHYWKWSQFHKADSIKGEVAFKHSSMWPTILPQFSVSHEASTHEETCTLRENIFNLIVMYRETT